MSVTQLLEPGARINTREEIESLPVGTRIAVGGAPKRWYERRPDGMWVDWQGFEHGDHEFTLGGTNRVVSIPEGAKRVLPSLRQWQWKWLDNCYTSAEQASVNYRTVETGMARAGLSWDDFPPGAGMTFWSRAALERVPTGSLLYRGKPANIHQFGMFTKAGGDLVHVLGNANGALGVALTVASVPDGTVADWAVAPGTPEEQDQIAEFKARVWRVGWKIKTQHGWCSSYESYMAKIGLDETALRNAKYLGIGVGDMVTPEQAASLRPRACLRWRSSQDQARWAWFIRDDTMSNAARTRYLFGTEASHRNYHSSMEVLSLADAGADDLDAPISRDEAEHLPPGSVLTIGAERYLMCHDHRVVTDHASYHDAPPERGQWFPRDFGANLILTSVPA